MIPILPRKADMKLYLSAAYCCCMIFFFVFSSKGHAIELSNEEVTYLRTKDTIVFVSQTQYPPFEFVDANGQHEGMMLDIIRWIAVEMGFKPVFMDMTFQQAQETVLSGKADILTSIFYSDKRKEKFEFTDPLFDVPASIFVKADRTDIKELNDLNVKTIAIQRGDYAREFLESQNIHFVTQHTKDFPEAINRVLAGKADAVIGDEQIVFYHIFSNRLTDAIKKAGEPLYIGKNCMASNQNNALLIRILTKGIIEAKKTGELHKIGTKWLGTIYNPPKPFLDRYRWYVAAFVGEILLILLLIWIWNIRLRILVRKKTADITCREQKLKVSEEKYRTLVENSIDPVFQVDATGHYTFVNPAVLRILGCESAQILGEHYIKSIRPDMRDEMEKFFGRQFVNRIPNTYCRFPIITKDGREVWLAQNTQLIFNNDQIVGFQAIARDITEHRRSEDLLRQEHAFRSAIIDGVAEGLCVCHETPDYPFSKFTIWNDRMTEITGYTMDEINRLGWYQAVYPDPELQAKAKERMKRMRQREDLHAEEWEITRADGDKRVLNITTSIVESGDGLPHVMALMQDISERKRARELLRKSENKYRLIAKYTADLISVLDMNLHFTYVSPASKPLRGFTVQEAMEQTLEQVLTPESLRLCHAVFETETLLEASGTADPYRTRILELETYRKDGSIIWMEVSLSFVRDKDRKPVEILIVSRDITERKQAGEVKAKLEAQLRQAQKFEAIGTLAGGIAHDFNNLLMGIQGRASLISSDLETSHPHLEHIHAIEEYIRSATNLTKQLLGIAMGGKYEVKPVDMNELVLCSSAMFGRTKKEIRIHTRCQKSSLVVEADGVQIEQVLLNMYLNAWQAMPPDGGELYLETKIVMLDEADCKPEQIEPGCYVKVSITDNGFGMDEATRLRILDPFFTTKEKSRGTGLGLASAYGIIKNHGGMIGVYSEIDHGTTFNIYLPVSNKEVHREIPMEAGIIKGSATILLVDDEEMIIEVGQAMLERLGYRVVVSRGGREAVQAITDMGTEIDLVIIDMIMPGMDGGRAFDCIREIRPGMPVLLSSGYTINGQAHEIMARGCNGFIQKPYNISELSNKVRNVLDADSGHIIRR